MKRIALTGLLAALLAGCSTQRSGLVVMLTDYGTRDPYVGVLVAGVLRANPNARIEHLTHEIEPFQIAEGAYVLAETVPEFPTGTIVLAVVDPGVGTSRAPLVVTTQAGHTLVGPDNGLFDPLIRKDGGVTGIWRIESPRLLRPGAGSSTFHGRDLFAPIAGHLSRGVPPASVGPPLEHWEPLALPEPHETPDGLRGAVLHVDHYGNVITNIPGEWLRDVPMGTTFELVQESGSTRCALAATYADVSLRSFVLLENASGRLEIAQNQGHAAAILGLHAGDALLIKRVSWPADKQ